MSINSHNSDDMTPVSSVAVSALLPTIMPPAPLKVPDPPLGDQCCTCIQCAWPVWGEKLAARCLRCVRLKGKGNEETTNEVRYLSTPLRLSAHCFCCCCFCCRRRLCCGRAAMSAEDVCLVILCFCHRIKKSVGKMRLKGKRHIFTGSVERLWPSRGAGYATLSPRCTSDKKKKRQILRTHSVLQPADVIPFQPHRGLNDRTTFQQDSGWNTTPHPPPLITPPGPPPPRTGCMGSGPTDWWWCLELDTKRRRSKFKQVLLKQKIKKYVWIWRLW